jgi:hypothetical protein
MDCARDKRLSPVSLRTPWLLTNRKRVLCAVGAGELDRLLFVMPFLTKLERLWVVINQVLQGIQWEERKLSRHGTGRATVDARPRSPAFDGLVCGGLEDSVVSIGSVAKPVGAYLPKFDMIGLMEGLSLE